MGPNAAMERLPTSRTKRILVRTPSCLACFKPKLHKKDPCADLRSHVLESTHLRCFAFTNPVKPNVSTTDTASIREDPALPPQWQAGVASGFGEKENIVGVMICLCLIQLRQIGNTCIKSKRTHVVPIVCTSWSHRPRNAPGGLERLHCLLHTLVP